MEAKQVFISRDKTQEELERETIDLGRVIERLEKNKDFDALCEILRGEMNKSHAHFLDNYFDDAARGKAAQEMFAIDYFFRKIVDIRVSGERASADAVRRMELEARTR